MKKNLRMLVCLVGGATLFGMGCGGAPQETPVEPEPQPTAEQQPGTVRQQAIYTVCWGELGLYDQPSTTGPKLGVLYYGHHFETTSQVFWSNGEYWVRGHQSCAPSAPLCYSSRDFYVRWGGLC